jgi:hypothetical protein
MLGSIARTGSRIAGLAFVFAAAACQGNIGGGGLPQPPGPQVTPNGFGAAQNRIRTTEGAVFLDTDTREIPFPDAAGFVLTLALVEPTPLPSGGAANSPAPAASSAVRTLGGTRVAGSLGSASPSVASTDKPATRVLGTPKAAATPTGPRIALKTTSYPDDAPAAPTPQPTGNVQNFAKRVALVRGSLMSRTDLKLYSLAAARFTIPTAEQTKGRGFTIALYESLKKRKSKLLVWDTNATLTGNVVGLPTENDPITLKRNVGYFFILYGDDVTPLPTPQGSYPASANGVIGSPGPGGATPFPTVTPFPQSTSIIGPH